MGAFKGTPGDDSLSGTNNDDQFNLIQGGEDSVSGLGGNDTFTLHAALDAGDAIDGGSGSDTVSLSGDYSAGLTFGATTIANVERLLLGAGFSYKLTIDDATVAAHKAMAIDGAHLGAGDALNFDGSAETDGKLTISGGAGNDILRGGSVGAAFDLRAGGEDTATGGASSDLFSVGGALDAGDHIDGGFNAGSGHDVLRIVGDYSAGLTLAPGTIQNITTLQFGAGFDYNITADAANFLSGPKVLIRGDWLGAGDSLTFDASASGANFRMTGGAGDDVLTGGSAADLFDLTHGGNDTAHGGGLGDHFLMGAAFTAADAIDGGSGSDTVELSGMGAADAITFSATTLTSVETLLLDPSASYALVTNDANVAAGATLLVNANSLAAADTLTFDGAAETDGHFIIRGGAGDDDLTGGAQSDTFNLKFGGDDVVHGGGGDDTIDTGAAFTAADRIDGGAGNDTVTLTAIGGVLSFTATTIVNVEDLAVSAAQGGFITSNDANVAAGATLTVDFSGSSSATDLYVFDGSQETDGHFHIIGPADAGSVAFIGGALSDTFTLSANFGLGSSVDGQDGDDTLTTVGTGRIQFSGNHGSDTLVLTGGGAPTLVVSSLETLSLDDNSWTITTPDTTIDAGATLTVDASALTASHALTFDGSAETDGRFAVTAGAGNDALTGGGQDDVFDLSAGGNDSANGGGGNDTFNMGATLTASDTLDGGAGSDTVVLAGNYNGPHALVFGAATMVNVETIRVLDGSDYSLTTNDATVAAGATLNVDASALTGGSLDFNGAAETDGSFNITGGSLGDTLAGGAQADIFNLGLGGFYSVAGGGGDDTFNLGGAYSTLDQVGGGVGNDTIILDGDYSFGLNFASRTMQSVETLQLGGGHSYVLTTADANVANGATLTVDATALGASNFLNFDGSAESDGAFAILGGAGDDAVALEHQHVLTNSTFNGGGGNDTLVIDGGLSSPVTFGAGALVSIETLRLAGGSSYDLITDDANVGAGATLTIDASALGAGDTLTFDGSAETDGRFAVTAGAGNDALTGGGQDDVFDLSAGGNDTANGGGGNDTFNMGATLTASDTLDGGAGSIDRLQLTGDYTGGNAVVFGAATLINAEQIVVGAGFSYNLTTDDATVAGGTAMTVDASALGAANALTFNGAAELDGAFLITAGAGNDTLTGGALSDVFNLTFGGNDHVHGGGGDDTINFGATLTASDSVDGGAGNDTVSLSGAAYGNFAISTSFLTSVETLQLTGSSTFGLKTTDASIASRLTIDGSALTAALTIDTSQPLGGGTTGQFTLKGGAGNDTFAFGSNFNAADIINGGAGSDTVTLNGNYSTITNPIFTAASIASVEKLVLLGAGHSYEFLENDANVAAGQTLTVDGSAFNEALINAGWINSITFNGAAETNGSFAFISDASRSVLIGGAQADSFDLTHSTSFGSVGSGGGGEDDSVTGNGGNDSFAFGKTLTATDKIDGGAGTDSLSLDGDYSAGVTFNASTVINIETLTLAAGHSYKFVTNDATVASGATLTVDASALGAANGLTFNGGVETNGSFAMTGGAGDDSLTGGTQSDSFNFTLGGNDIVNGGAGNDTFSFGATFTAADTVHGGGDNDTLSLSGDYSAGVTLGAATMAGVENIVLAAGHSYAIAADEANVATGATLTLDASALGSGDSLRFAGNAETDGHFVFTGGAGADSFTGGAAGDTVTGGGGGDTITLGAGANQLVYNAVSDSTSTDFDAISNVHWTTDLFHISGFATVPTAIDTAVTTGALSAASFNGDLAAAVGAGQLGADHAVLFTADAGDEAGKTFLIVDVNGTAGYQANQDLVIEIVSSSGTLTTANFT